MLPDLRVRQRDYLLHPPRVIPRESDLDAVLARILRVAAERVAGHARAIARRVAHGGRPPAACGVSLGRLRGACSRASACR